MSAELISARFVSAERPRFFERTKNRMIDILLFLWYTITDCSYDKMITETHKKLQNL